MQSRKSILIDANIILRYLLCDSKDLYYKAEKFFKEIEKGNIKAYIHHAVLAEVVYVLTKVYKIKRNEIADILIEFISHKGILVDNKEIIINSLRIYCNSNYDYVDCLLCAYSYAYTVYSFDKDINNYISKERLYSGWWMKQYYHKAKKIKIEVFALLLHLECFDKMSDVDIYVQWLTQEKRKELFTGLEEIFGEITFDLLFDDDSIRPEIIQKIKKECKLWKPS